jgi:hypothetical protein
VRLSELFVILGAVAFLIPSGCTTEQAASSVICQPSQLVRCNSCPMTGQCASTVCEGWLQCSADGTKFVGTCSDCAPDDPDDDSCVSLQTCCAESSLPGSEKGSCEAVVTANDADTCFALLNQYLGNDSCGGVTDPPPPPPEGGVVSKACTALASCCDAAYNSAQAAASCGALVSEANDTACADAEQLYCTRPDAGVDAPADVAKSDVVVADVQPPDAECTAEGGVCESGVD